MDAMSTVDGIYTGYGLQRQAGVGSSTARSPSSVYIPAREADSVCCQDVTEMPQRHEKNPKKSSPRS